MAHQKTADQLTDARQTTFHTPQPNWGVAPGWPRFIQYTLYAVPVAPAMYRVCVVVCGGGVCHACPVAIVAASELPTQPPHSLCI
eukprot:scaffold591_cov121-Isochrysis_galbana.AAC.4